jgi:antibiotic biosynthesis monooxygenase (ABM) superfamily enzyme
MTRVIYQVRLKVKPEHEDAFNAWYEETYIPKLMREVPHFYNVHRSVGALDGERVYVTDYETTDEDLETAVAEMRSESRKPDNAEFYRWKDKAITLHESLRLYETLSIDNGVSK